MTIDIEGDFQPVKHTGGKVTFNFSEQDGEKLYRVGFEGANPYPMSLFALHVTLPQRIALPVIHLAKPISAPVPSSLLVFVASDREGFFGKLCPWCKRYFRTEAAIERTWCPYCGMGGPSHTFLSESQRKYIETYVDAFEKGYDSGQSFSLDLDALVEEAGSNESPPSFSEERQQTRFQCTKCRTWTDIVGRYGKCPNCGHRNSFALASRQMDALEDRVKNPRYLPDRREERDGEWRLIVKECVSVFEGFGRDLLGPLVELPATPTRKKAVAGIGFHDPLKAAENLKSFFDIDLLRDLGTEEQVFIRARFKRRHIYEHTAGVADQEYVDFDPTVRVGQLVKEKSSHAATLIKHLRTMMKNFDDAFHSFR